MLHSSPGHCVLRQATGAVGVVALMMLGAAPAGAADSEPGLVLGRVAPIEGVKPGSEFSVPIPFTNTGTAPLRRVWIQFTDSQGLLADMPDCGGYDDGTPHDGTHHETEFCKFGQTVDPGVVYTPDIKLKALDDAMYDQLKVTIWSTEPGADDNEQPPPGAPTETVKVTADNTADLQVASAELKGGVGDTVPLTVKFTNAGPGWVDLVNGVPETRVRVTMPAGTSVTKADERCKNLGSRTFDCGTGYPAYDEPQGNYNFNVRIDEAVPGAKGSVALTGQPRPFDPVTSNDTEAILLDVTGNGATGGSPTASPSASSSTGGTGATPGPGAGATHGSPTTGTSGTPSTGGALADTGSGPVLPLTCATAGATLLGAGAFLRARRRATRQQ